MVDTPYTPTYPTLQIEIDINGNPSSLHTVLKKATVHYELNKIPSAKFLFISSNPSIDSEEDQLESESIEVTDDFELKLNIEEDVETIFKGIVYKTERNAEPSGGFEIKVECKDIAAYLTTQQEEVADESFVDKMDRFLGEIGMTNEVELQALGDEFVTKTQNVTPWDYLVSHLDGLGHFTTIREGVFTTLDTTEESEDPVFLAQNGVNVFEFEGRQEESVTDVEIRYWDPETQSVVTQASATNATNGRGKEIVDMSQSSFSPETLEQMAKGLAAKNRLASVKGRVKTFGNLEAKYGEQILFERVNPNIDGIPLLIASEHHTIENGSWNTEYTFGLESNQSFAQNISSGTSAAQVNRTGQMNSVQGLLIGVVTQLEDDPANEFRIRVRIPSISESGEGVWARLSSFQAGSERGAFFIPEVGDEVILGCLNNNPDTPVILGKLYSSSYPMPFSIEADNNIQGIVSKEGTKMVMDDGDKAIELSTKQGNKLLISDAEKGFLLEDENGNKLMMNSDGITLESAKDITLKAASKINMEGAESTLEASGNMVLKGTMIKLN